MSIIIAVLAVIMIIGAVAAVLLKNVVASILTAGSVSLTASIIYIFAAAPDVAMTEAAIGSALTTVVFLLVVYRMKKEDLND